MLQKVKERLNLGEHETNLLSEFDDVVLGDALKAYEKTTGISHPFRYFLGCCNRIKEKLKTTTPTMGRSSKQAKGATPQGPWLPAGPTPFISKGHEWNMQRWHEYEASPEYKAYAAFDWQSRDGNPGKYQLDLQYERFMKKLEGQHKGAMTIDPVTPEIKRESILTDVVTQDQPKTQPKEKDLTLVKIDRVSTFNDPKIKISKKHGYVIHEWLDGHMEYKFEPAVYDLLEQEEIAELRHMLEIVAAPKEVDVGYNPANEEEVVDSFIDGVDL